MKNDMFDLDVDGIWDRVTLDKDIASFTIIKLLVVIAKTLIALKPTKDAK